MRLAGFVLFGVVLFCSVPAPHAAPEAVFMAGAASREITPREPLPMWGYSARRDALSTGTLDPLFADAVVIQAGAHKLAIVGLDLGRSPSEASLSIIRRRIQEEAGIAHAFVGGSHTHHGPVLELVDRPGRGQGRFDAAIRYYRELEEAIVAAVLEADSRLVPARLAAGSVALEGFNRNRHTKIEPRPTDPELRVLRLDDLEGRTLAVLANFAAHPTMLPATGLEFSADFVGPLKRVLSDEIGGTALFMQGAAGDLSVQATGREGHEAYGSALGREAARLAAGLPYREIGSPGLQVREDRFTFASRTDFANPLIRLFFERAFFPELVAAYLDEYAEGVRPRLTVALLNGEIALVGVSGEVFSQHAVRLRERARVSELFFFGYTNGYHQYFPTIEAAAEGGYGADSTVSPAEVGAGEQLMDTALVWIYEMLGKF